MKLISNEIGVQFSFTPHLCYLYENMGDSKTLKNAPDIFGASDFRTFLKDYYNFRKSKSGRFSYTSFARQLGFGSRSYIQHLIDGKRNLSREGIEKFRRLFKTDQRKFEHFQTMVLRDQAKSKKEKALFARKIMAQCRLHRSHQMTAEELVIYSDWFCVPVFFMAYAKGFKADSRWIRDHLMFPVALAQIEAAINKLLRLGYWKKENDGTVVPVHEAIDSFSESSPIEILTRFHSKMLDLSRTAADWPIHERLLTGSTVQLSPDEYAKLKDLIWRFSQVDLAEFSKAVPTRPEDRIYHLAISIFPVTKPFI